MNILLGTTNPSKVGYFARVLEGTEISFVTLRDLGVTEEPEETGATPRENAAIKARFYARYAPEGVVICADSGFYLDSLPLDDPLQPGLHVRTPGGGKRLDDEEMIAYYAAAVMANGKLHTFQQTREEARANCFYLVDVPSEARREGWPIDTVAKTPDGYYFLDPNRPVQVQQSANYKPALRTFLLSALGL